MLTEFVTKLLTLILGYAVPAYECVESIELLPTRVVDLRFWCKYWIIVNIWYIFDEITDALASRLTAKCRLTETACREEQQKYKMVSSPSLEMALHNNFLYFNHRIPMYRELKLAFIMYLSFPTTKAADVVYKTIFRPVMMLIMLCEWNIKWRLLPHLCETLDSFMCRARDLHWYTWRRGVVHRSSRSSLPKVTEKNAEDIRPDRLSSSEEEAIADMLLKEIQRDRPRSPDKLVEAAEAEMFFEEIQRDRPRLPDELVEAAKAQMHFEETQRDRPRSSANEFVESTLERMEFQRYRPRFSRNEFVEVAIARKDFEEIQRARPRSLAHELVEAAKAKIFFKEIRRARPRSPADELVEVARGGTGGEDMKSHRRRSVSRRLWGMRNYQKKVHVFVGNEEYFLCIWGMRGVGKSALLRLLRDSYAGGTSFDHVLFVGAGTAGCTVHNMQHAIATSFGLDLSMMSLLDELSRARVIHRLIRKRDEGVLLLVDDVREPFDFSGVGLPIISTRRHKIICATRSRTVCAEMNAPNIIEMRCLREDDAWNLFKDKVGIVDAQPPAHPHVHQLAKKMVAECRGLPLALCVIGRAMSSKTDPREWRNAYNLLKAKHSQNQEDEGYSYLDILENELKDSFLVTSLWPKDGSIPTEPMRI